MSTKRHCSSHTTKAGNEARARKKVRLDLEWSRKASLVDEEIRYMRVIEMVVGDSSSVLVCDEMSTSGGM